MAEDIFGTNLGSLKEKTNRGCPTHVEVHQPNPIPITIMDKYDEVTLANDVMFINNIPFFTSISQHIKFGTAERLINQQASNLMKAIKGICNLYALRGFTIILVLGDNDFETLRGELAQNQIQLNTAAPDKHVPEIERFNRSIKNRCRAIYSTLPFKKIPHMMMALMVYFSIFWINLFPVKSGLSSHVIPLTIITGLTIDFNTYFPLEFGAYVQTHEAHGNNMSPRTIGAICLGPRGSIQGGYNFMGLSTGERIHRREWTSLPMPKDVIDRVHKLATASPTDMAFEDKHGNIIEDQSDIDSDTELDNLGTTVITSYENNHHEDTEEEENQISHDYDNINANQAPTPIDLEQNHMPESDHDDQSTQDISNPVEIVGVEVSPFICRSTRVIKKPERLIETHMLNAKGFHKLHLMIHGASIKPNIEQLKPLTDNTGMEAITMTQYSMKQGLKQFGQRDVDALITELRQIDTRKVMDPIHGRLLSKEDKRKRLNYLIFLKEKRTGIIKGRGCADGRNQQSLITKENTSSPTVSLESLLLTCVIDAK
jgi:hypothetical protein